MLTCSTRVIRKSLRSTHSLPSGDVRTKVSWENIMDRILCVDDDVNVLAGLERQFRKRFEVVTAVGAEKALEILQDVCGFAVILSDFKMPRMNGIQFLAKACELSPASVRILLTGQ